MVEQGFASLNLFVGEEMGGIRPANELNLWNHNFLEVMEMLASSLLPWLIRASQAFGCKNLCIVL